MEGVGRSFGSLRKCFGRVKSAARTEGGEGVYIGAPQKTSCYCVVYVLVGTSETRSELPTSYFSTGREGFVGNYIGPKGWSELLTLGWNFRPIIFSWPSTYCREKAGTSDGGRNF